MSLPANGPFHWSLIVSKEESMEEQRVSKIPILHELGSASETEQILAYHRR